MSMVARAEVIYRLASICKKLKSMGYKDFVVTNSGNYYYFLSMENTKRVCDGKVIVILTEDMSEIWS